MVPIIDLSHVLSVREAGRRTRDALDAFASLEPNKYALGDWLYGPYRSALLLHPPVRFSLKVATDIETTIIDAKTRLSRALVAATHSFEGEFLGCLPRLIHVVRMRDELGCEGVGPIDVPGASLSARALSLLMADYLTCPESYEQQPDAPLAPLTGVQTATA